MNRAAQQLGRLGGLATSEAKRRANRAKIKAYWADVKAGKVAAPKHVKRRLPNTLVRQFLPRVVVDLSHEHQRRIQAARDNFVALSDAPTPSPQPPAAPVTYLKPKRPKK